MSQGNSTVTYRVLPDDPGYRVGTDGSVWSCLARRGTCAYVPTEAWRRLKPSATGNGYLAVCLRGRWWAVHRLILETFIGLRPDGMECCHADGNRANNALANLRWDTPQANAADAIRHGTKPLGERHANAKVTAEVVRTLRSRHATGGVTYAELGREHGLTKEQVANICQRKQWKHIH
jgi:hypothetical protein